MEKVICGGAASEHVAFLAVVGLRIQASWLDRGCDVRRRWWILQKFAGVATALLRARQRCRLILAQLEEFLTGK